MKGSFEELQELLFVEPLPKHIKEQSIGKFIAVGMSYKLKENVYLDHHPKTWVILDMSYSHHYS